MIECFADEVIVQPGFSFAHWAPAAESPIRCIAALSVPVLFRWAGVPTLLDGIGFRAFDTADEIRAVLREVLRSELRSRDDGRLQAMAREIGPVPAATGTASDCGVECAEINVRRYISKSCSPFNEDQLWVRR